MADMWPRFLYEDHTYDPNEPTKGLFKGPMLVRVSIPVPTEVCQADWTHDRHLRPFLHPQALPTKKTSVPTLLFLINGAAAKGVPERMWPA